MPKLPLHVENAIQNKERPDKKGEEGLLYRLKLDEEAYYAKRWIGNKFMHPEKPWRPSMTLAESAERSPTSPYFHKVTFHEYGLMNQAFPDSILRVQLAYDPRIQRDETEESGHKFDNTDGIPVTVTEEAKGDPGLVATRDAIHDRAYEAIHASYREVEGTDRIFPDRDTDEAITVMRAEVALRALFGPEIHIDPRMLSARREGADIGEYDTTRTEAMIDYALGRAKEVNPKSQVVQMLEAGILPIHPEFNFIPQSLEGDEGAQGVFLEVAIVSVERFLNHLIKRINQEYPESDKPKANAAQKRKAKRKVQRYLMYRKLDEMFSQWILEQYSPNRNPLKEENNPRYYEIVGDTRIQNAIFQVTEQARLLIEEYGLAVTVSILDRCAASIDRTLQRYEQVDMCLFEIENWREILERWNPSKER